MTVREHSPAWRMPWTEPQGRRVAVTLIAAGILLRLLWLIAGHHLGPFGGESQNIAVSLAQGHGFANAYAPDSGPTAHISPTTPALAALAYLLFGPLSPAAELALSVVAVLIVGTGIYVLYLLMAELGAPLLARLGAVALTALFPFQFSVEVVEFRTWEAGLATTVMAAVLLAIVKADREPLLGWRRMFLISVACGVLGVISPAPGLAASGALGVLLLRRARVVQWPVAVVAVVATALVISLPWAMRNEAKLGARIWTRSTVGLQKAMTYADGALTMDPLKFYLQQHNALSPVHPEAYQRMKAAGGEVAYYRQLNAQATAWMAAHRSALPVIWGRNLRDFYLPPERFYTRFGSKGTAVEARRALAVVLSALGLASLIGLLLARQWRYLYVAAVVALASAPYVMTFPLMRYRYAVSSLLIFLALDGTFRLLQRLRRGGPEEMRSEESLR